MNLREHLSVMEDLLESMRWARSLEPSRPERRTYEIMREIAADIRRRLPGSSDAAIQSFERRIDDAKRRKTAIGYDSRALIGIGQETIGRWPIIREALLAQAENRDGARR